MSRLEELRVSKGYTQEFIATNSGIAISTYSQYENGGRTVPLEVAERIARIIGCSLEEIFLPKKFTVSKIKGNMGQDSDEKTARRGGGRTADQT